MFIVRSHAKSTLEDPLQNYLKNLEKIGVKNLNTITRKVAAGVKAGMYGKCCC